MDFRVSRKIPRYQPYGTIEVLVSNVFDLYPVLDPVDENIITDVEILDDVRDETLDQAMWAIVKQRGADPLDPTSGNQHEECILGEVNVVALMSQIINSVSEVGPGVQVSFDTGVADGKEYLTVTAQLTNAV